MRYRLAEQGTVLSTRERAARVRADLEALLREASPGHVVIDFDGVRALSYSFTDELVGSMMQRAAEESYPVPVLENLNSRTQRFVEESLRARGLDLQAAFLTPA